MCEETKFEVGDEVEWCGAKGVVENVRNTIDQYSIVARFGREGTVSFSEDGKYYKWHNYPSLKLIKKAKKPVKKWQWLYVTSSGFYHMTNTHYSHKDQVEIWLVTKDKVIKPILETEKEFYE